MEVVCVGKSSWPELWGEKAADAVARIQSENPLVAAIVVDRGSAVITDYRCDRVWVWVDKNGTVVRVPRIG